MKPEEIRGRGRPPLPEAEALIHRTVLRLNDADAALLTDLAAALDCTEAEALRAALRAYGARKVKS